MLRKVATLVTAVFLTVCSIGTTATTFPAATIVVRTESTQSIEQATPAATFTSYPPHQVPETKSLDYKTIYEEGNFKIREAFLGSDRGWKWRDFSLPQARIQNTVQDLGLYGRCELAELQASGWCTNTARVESIDGQERTFAFSCDHIGGGYCLLKRNSELIWQGNLVASIGAAVQSSKRIGNEIAIGYGTITPEGQGRSIISILLTKGNTVIDIVGATHYDFAFAPNEIQGKLVYFAMSEGQVFVVFDGKKVGEKYETVFDQYCCWDGPPVQIFCNGEVVDFFATRENGWYHVQAGDLTQLK